MRAKGKITSWNEDKGFGFITPFEGGKDLFIHINAFINRSHTPQPGQVVTYTISTDKQGRPCAMKASLPGDVIRERPKPSRSGKPQLLLAACFMFFVMLSAVFSLIPVKLLVIYLLISLITLLVYWMDKTAAKADRRRVSEKNLHLLALAGGWPGAALAQQLLRHKTTKQSFRSMFWVTVTVNAGLFVWFLTPSGNQQLNTLLGFF